MKINAALLQFESFSGEMQRNREKAEELIIKACTADVKPDLIVLPELWPSAFEPGNLQEQTDKCREAADGESISLMKSLAAKFHVFISAGSIAIDHDRQKCTNTNFLIGPEGEILSRYDKAHLCGWVGEDQIIAYGQRPSVVTTDIGRIGTVICYDIRFAEWVRICALNGSQIIIIPSAWGSPLEQFRVLTRARAMENQVYVLACGTCGGNGFKEAGHSAIIGPDGSVIAEARDKEEILSAEINLDEVDRVRKVVDYQNDRRPDLYEQYGIIAIKG